MITIDVMKNMGVIPIESMVTLGCMLFNAVFFWVFKNISR